MRRCLIGLFIAGFSRKDSMFSISCGGVSAQRFVLGEERPDRRLGRAVDGCIPVFFFFFIYINFPGLPFRLTWREWYSVTS